MAREPGLIFRGIPPAIMARACLLAARGIAGPSCDGADVLRLAVSVGLLALESAGRGQVSAVELCRTAGATILDAQLSPVDDDAPEAIRELVAELGAAGTPAGVLSAPPPSKKTKAPVEPKPETPDQIGWRTWRDRYLLRYRRPYSATGADGNAMKGLVALALEQLEQLGRPLADLEPLLVHRWDKYLADPGNAKTPGGPGWNADKAHGLRWAELGIPAYGTPWDREAGKAREPQVLPPTLPGGKKYAGRPT